MSVPTELTSIANAEDHVLNGETRKKRILLNDGERRCSAIKGKIFIRNRFHGDRSADIRPFIAYHLLFAVGVVSRRVHFADCSTSPEERGADEA